MAKNKLRKFSEMEQIDFVFQYPYSVLKDSGFPLRGKWNAEFFHNDNPIVLELGCGKGEYTVGLGRRFPDVNFIGIDIKGARMWSGATDAKRSAMTNVAFVRTSIELLENFFAPGEVNSIWITFPDPQMKKVRKRLTSTRFMQLYRTVLADGGRINLKTDSPFLYNYTRNMCLANSSAIKIVTDTDNLYANPGTAGSILDIRTHYEQQWLDRGLTIKYLAFDLDANTPLSEIDDSDIERDSYRSYSRGQLECPQLLSDQDNND
jgi:tRNA (guanine-N7-)-methyltransferase